MWFQWARLGDPLVFELNKWCSNSLRRETHYRFKKIVHWHTWHGIGVGGDQRWIKRFGVVEGAKKTAVGKNSCICNA